MDLCDVFHNVNIFLSILVGAQNSIYNWTLIKNNSINKLISYKLEKKPLTKLQFQHNLMGKFYQSQNNSF